MSANTVHPEAVAVFLLRDLADTERFGRAFAALVPDRTVVSLNGTLGAGKTKFTQAIASGLGIDPQDVTSPTFVLCQEYHGSRNLFHFDAYRLAGCAEFQTLGPDEYFQSPGVTVIEWGDRVSECLPIDRLDVQLVVAGETARQIEIFGTGAANVAVVEALKNAFPEQFVAPPAQKARVWTAILATLLTIPLAAILSIVVVTFCMLLNLEVAALRNPQKVQAWVEQFTTTRVGFLALVLPGQLTFLGVALGAAWLSPKGMTDRLQLREGRLPMWTWPIFALATPVIAMATTLLISFIITEPSPHLEMLENLFRSHRGPFTLVVIATVAFLPGIGEEMLFRGYLQSRLLRRLRPASAIAISTMLFSAAHIDPVHVLAVIPLGLWLGILAWRADSIWPSVVCHATNNATSIILTQTTDAHSLEIKLDAFVLVLLGVGLVATCLSVWLLRRKFPTAPTPTS